MESIENKQKRRGYTIHNDPEMRYTRSQPPSSPTRPQRGLDVDLGSSGFTIGSKSNAGRPLRNMNRISDGSDDEIDSITGSNVDSDEADRLRIVRVSVSSKATNKSQEYHPDFLPRNRKLPNFKKKAASEAAKEPASSQRSSTSDAYNVLSDLRGNENGDVSKSHAAPRARLPRTTANPHVKKLQTFPKPTASTSKAPQDFPSLSPLRSSPDAQQSKTRGKDKDKASESMPDVPVLSDQPGTRNRPLIVPSSGDSSDDLPRPLSPSHSRSSISRKAGSPIPSPSSTRPVDDSLEHEDVLCSEDEEVEDTPRAKKVSRRRTSSPTSERAPSSSRAVGLTDAPLARARPKPRPVTTHEVKRDLADFPSLSPLSSLSSSQSDEQPLATPPRAKGKASAASFPIPSPLSSPVSYPHYSPPRSNIQSSQSLSIADGRNVQRLRHPAIKPFPVSISPLKESQSVEDTLSPSSLMLPRLGSENASVSLSPRVDPKLLCPYCDSRLPPEDQRTPQLRKVLADAAKRSQPQPRPGNPLGRLADFPISGAVCIRHEFETTQLPQARANGWPETIDWPALRARIEDLRPRLGSIVRGDPGARETSIFWTAVVRELKKSGSRTVAGIKGQFENFEKVQPGYYGEIGANIIYQTLYNLFPPSSFDAASIAPLSPDTVLQRVLLPEAALALVMEDLSQDADEAERTLRDSARYGATMFAADDDGAGGVGDDVGHGMVRERARARAREIAAEERVEKRMLEEERRKRAAADRESSDAKTTGVSPKRYKKTPPRELESTDDDDIPVAVPTTKPKPRPKPATKKRTGLADSESDASARSTRSTRSRTRNAPIALSVSEESDSSIRSTRSRTRAAARVAAAGYASLSDSSDIEITEVTQNYTKPRPRPVSKRAPASSDMDISGNDGILGIDMLTPRPPRRIVSRVRDPSIEVVERPTRWSTSLREDPIIVSDSSGTDSKKGKIRMDTSKPSSRGSRAQDQWLLASDD